MLHHGIAGRVQRSSRDFRTGCYVATDPVAVRQGPSSRTTRRPCAQEQGPEARKTTMK